MNESHEQIVEGIFAISKPPTVTTPQVLLDLQDHFVTSTTFEPLLEDIRRKREEQNAHKSPTNLTTLPAKPANPRPFKMGHGGTLDPLASGVLIIGIGRGTKVLSSFLGGTKTYEVIVLFGKSTESFDISGAVTEVMDTQCVTKEVVEHQLAAFRGTFKQVPPIYSALKINGMKACEYVRAGKELPRELEAREVCVDECEMVEYMPSGSHEFRWQSMDATAAAAPAVCIRLTVSSGFYVRSFCDELGRRCGSVATMAALVRTRQSGYVLSPSEGKEEGCETAITYEELAGGEGVWGPKISATLRRWMEANSVKKVRMNGHGRTRVENRSDQLQNDDTVNKNTEAPVRQRFRGEWLAGTRKERIKQQGGKWKGKYNKPKSLQVSASTDDAETVKIVEPVEFKQL